MSKIASNENISSTHIRSDYFRRAEGYRRNLALAQKKSTILSNLRLIVFLAGVGALAYSFYGPRSMSLLALLLGALFLYLLVRHAQVNEEVEFLDKMGNINETAVKRMDGAWTQFPDDGAKYIDHSHPFTSDLNIFGKGSLFQYFYVPLTFGGEERLVELLRSQPEFSEIVQRQEAVADMAHRLDFRQHMQATVSHSFFKKKNPQEVLAWLEKDYNARYLPQVVFFLPVVTLALFAFAALGLIPFTIPLGSLAFQALIAFWGNLIVSHRFLELDKPVLRLKRYVDLLKWIETEKFKAQFLKKQKKRIFAGAVPASRLIGNLVQIAERNDLRHSNALIYYLLNILFFWDLWTLRKLEAWQKSWGHSVREWFEAVREVEAVSCLSGIYHDNPDWIFPTIHDDAPFINAKNIAHPLIPIGERIGNDLSMPQQGRVLIITGSNMSGKSTLLRTIGINMVLAYTGAPVCAGELICSAMHIYCKMQIHDNLTERISTFYAELKRMKIIIDAAKTKEPLLALMDEIFRGTNSRDRIIATRTVIHQLHALNTITLLTTHDLELGSLAKEYPGTISNYHFTDDIKEDHINFDYKIKPGISKTANAVALMKMIGIGVEES